MQHHLSSHISSKEKQLCVKQPTLSETDSGLLTVFLQLMLITRSSSSSSLQAYPMLTAVSNLSPVSTHTWIPASRSATMVSGTPSCRRSSMPVAPAARHKSKVRQDSHAEFIIQYVFQVFIMNDECWTDVSYLAGTGLSQAAQQCP